MAGQYTGNPSLAPEHGMPAVSISARQVRTWRGDAVYHTAARRSRSTLSRCSVRSQIPRCSSGYVSNMARVSEWRGGSLLKEGARRTGRVYLSPRAIGKGECYDLEGGECVSADPCSGEHPGKCRITDDHAHIGWGGGEVWIRPFYVLAYNNTTRR